MSETFQIAVFGLGGRGQSLIECAILPACEDFGAEITAVYDPYADRTTAGADIVEKITGKLPLEAKSAEEVLAIPEIKAVIISSAWESHVDLAIKAMKAGKYAAFEVGGAYSLENCWKLVETYEETGVPCMMLENISYGRPELAVFNMVRKGLFGEIIHAEGGYCHFFETRMVGEIHEGYYRVPHYLHRNCDNYPCHGMALPFMALDINRGNRFVSLVSVATKTVGLRNEC